MGAITSCTCTERGRYRFKDLIIAVYHDAPPGTPNDEALAKLNNYVASNPERIPRVCRKINKIIRSHLLKEQRVVVSMRMLHSLIEHSARVDDYVPHSLDMCTLLLSTAVSRYHVWAANVLSTLCHRLGMLPNTDSARRLIADNKDGLVPKLLLMGNDHLASWKEVKPVQTRYAAISALSSMAHCLHTALAGSAEAMMETMIVNLIGLLRERAETPLSSDSMKRLTGHHSDDVDVVPAPIPSIDLPTEREERDVMYALACSNGIGATAACTTTAGVEKLLSGVTELLDKQKGWGVPYVPALVFGDIVASMQRRPQQLGFSVYQCLGEVGQHTSDPTVRVGVLRSMQVCVNELPMTGGRPAIVLDHIMGAIQLPLADGGTTDAEGARPQEMYDAIVTLTACLLRSTYRQRNAPQLQSILLSLWHLLETARDRGARHTMLVLRLLDVAAPYVRTVPLVDRKELRATQGLDDFLSGSNDAVRYIASRILAGVLAGIPAQQAHGREEVLDDGAVLPSSVFVGSLSSAHSLSRAAAAAGAFVTDEEDVAVAREWVQQMSKATEGVTPRLIVSVADVLTAIVASCGVSGMPFTLTFLWSLQQRCVRAEAVASSASRGKDVKLKQPVDAVMGLTASSALTRAWLHMIVAVLVRCGRLYALPKLQAYGQDVLNKRAAAGQLASCFEIALCDPSGATEFYTRSGLRYHASQMAVPLAVDWKEAPVSKLLSFPFVSNIIAVADRADIAAVFSAAGQEKEEQLHSTIERVCFQKDSEVGMSLSQATAAREPSLATESTIPKVPQFSLSVTDETKVAALRSLRISVADNGSSPAQGNPGDVPLSVTATTTAQKVQEITNYYNITAATHVLPPEASAALPPLPMLPSIRDEDTSGGMSDFSEPGSAIRNRGTPPLYPVGFSPVAVGGSGGVEKTEDGAWVNPLDVDVGIQTPRRSRTTPLLDSLPAARYVSIS